MISSLADLIAGTIVVNLPRPGPYKAPAVPTYSATDVEFGPRPRRLDRLDFRDDQAPCSAPGKGTLSHAAIVQPNRVVPAFGHRRLKVRGDHEGYDILSFDESGVERLVEVKTTQYGSETPFFVSRNERATSESRAVQYHVYRLFAFRERPRLYTLPGAIGSSCRLTAATFMAQPK